MLCNSRFWKKKPKLFLLFIFFEKKCSACFKSLARKFSVWVVKFWQSYNHLKATGYYWKAFENISHYYSYQLCWYFFLSLVIKLYQFK